MSSAADALAIQLDQYGQVVTHRPRSASTFNIVGLFTRSKLTPLKDDREGRGSHNTASLTTGLTDTNGTTVTIDDQGEFAVSGERWSITNVAPVDGGWLVTLNQVDRKTMRHLPGNG